MGKRAGACVFLVVLFQLIREKIRSQSRHRSCSREISASGQSATVEAHSLIIITKHKLEAEKT